MVDSVFSLTRCHYHSYCYLYFQSLGVITSVTADVEKLVVSLLPSALPPDQEHIKLVSTSNVIPKSYSNHITSNNKMNRTENFHLHSLHQDHCQKAKKLLTLGEIRKNQFKEIGSLELSLIITHRI